MCIGLRHCPENVNVTPLDSLPQPLRHAKARRFKPRKDATDNKQPAKASAGMASFLIDPARIEKDQHAKQGLELPAEWGQLPADKARQDQRHESGGEISKARNSTATTTPIVSMRA
ncbi:hypothetical protein LTR09_010737 [Extremus antarcticus]|uniref:Uncharacterized protein n=1 Tax=Extremus antarcticus TaxID=702011 RepID=A0AAJ0DDA0_9PEZI|nr:hypothetical protein LTR09_010737 [Extremus antarcticus]